MSVSNILFKSCLIIGTVTVLACCEEFRVGPLAAQAEDPKPFSPECLGGYFDCKGIPDGNAQDLGCGCDEPAPGPCGCEPCSDPVDCLGVPNGTAQDLGCGCGKPAPGECGCEACPVDCFGVTNGTAEDLGCGCGQPAPGKCGCKPCQECLWVAAWANFTDDPGRGMTKYSLEYLEKQFKYKGNKAVPGCFVKKWSGKRADCGIHRKDTKSGSKQRWGLCGVAADYTTPDDLGTFLGDPDMDEAVHKVSKDSDALETYTWYMDKNCHWTNLTPDKKICGFAGVSWSPISLIWDDGVSLEEGMTVASFSINAAEPESYSLWKASDKAPLLVYDPQKGGRVTSAKQLFGAYSFGGQTTRVTDYQADELRAPWTNG
ncbi:MAG TPA: hypothetical protein PLP17_05870, partial [Oligoflexia bacterium]|nr:hypothetical protein [Oligoflexia bacterium]